MPRYGLLPTICGLLLLCAGTAFAVDPDPFSELIRPTDPLTPIEQQQTFRLPPGFEIELFASEPDILKPMNMAFDARGRLWITNSIEYPFAAPDDREARDSVKVLADTDGDGRADKITTFADGLNIPIGLYPYRDGVIVFSIPNIWFLRDTDGDGRADERTVLYGPMGWQRDTHGLNNAFCRGYDGWLYACHGFNNETTVAGDDGHTIQMHSGNTYRMRLDGSRIEHFTWGQVNPFGMSIDRRGNLFTADCHSKPIYQLLRGGYYPSFGKPHDGLGFVPEMTRHGHGSTAIAGIVVYDADHFPPEFRGNIFTGNVMTSRVNRDSLEYHGSTITAREEPDLVATSDSWFRPVDIQLGPDGALYVADFYNRIIGHYEVPLDHPERDRHRGRIWRITYTGNNSPATPAESPPDLSKAAADELIEALGDQNITIRNLATDELVDRIGAAASERVRDAFLHAENENVRSLSAWVLHRLDAIDEALLRKAAGDESAIVRVHAMRILSETSNWSTTLQHLAREALMDDDAFVQRAAADALGQHPVYENIEPLLDALGEVPEDDELLTHGIRIALRNTLRVDENFVRLQQRELSEHDSRAVAGVALAVDSQQSGEFLLGHLRRFADNDSGNRLREQVQHAARHIDANHFADLAEFARTRFAGDLDFSRELLLAMHAGLARRGLEPDAALVDWADTLAVQLLEAAGEADARWVNRPLTVAATTDNPWVVQQRRSSDGERMHPFLCSLLRGEQLTGILQSPEFGVPRQLSFFIAGHNDRPDKPDAGKNRVRLRDVQTGAILAETTPPRNDVAQQVVWELGPHAGKQARLEIVDGHDGGAYAWLAVGRFEPNVISVPALNPAAGEVRLTAACEIVEQFGLQSQRPRLASLLDSARLSPAESRAAAGALVALDPDSRRAALALAVGDVALSEALRREIGRWIARRDRNSAERILETAMKAAPSRLQLRMAEQLAGDVESAQSLLDMITRGLASARLLQQPTITLKLEALRNPELIDAAERLTTGLPTQNEQLEKLVESRIAAYRDADTNADGGPAVYRKHCAACHQLDGGGALVGPQLDGIGNRGLERLIEDVLDPNRNVDVAFHTTTIVLADGKIVTGLMRREEGNLLVLVNDEGKEFTVDIREIDEQVKSQMSLMPANVGELVPEPDFHALIAYLLSERAKPDDGAKTSQVDAE